MYEKDLAQLRERSPSRRDRIGAPASVEQIRALDQASKREFGIALPEAYVEFLRVCNGFRVNDSRILGADAETLPGGETLPALDGFLSVNRSRRAEFARSGLENDVIILSWIDRSTFVMKPNGTFWEQDPLSGEDIEQFMGGTTLIRSVVRRVFET